MFFFCCCCVLLFSNTDERQVRVAHNCLPLISNAETLIKTSKKLNEQAGAGNYPPTMIGGGIIFRKFDLRLPERIRIVDRICMFGGRGTAEIDRAKNLDNNVEKWQRQNCSFRTLTDNLLRWHAPL
uniref:Putative secreted protein n=1 Tax=Anopheles darlingi TaxID=43151 RepID=A0A2M4DH00_ANODA